MSDATATAAKFEHWAIIEIMGHQRLAGRVTEETIAGTALLRVDVPEIPARDEEFTSYESTEDFRTRPVKRTRTIPAIAGFTTYVGGGSIYRLTPVSEDVARRAVEQFRERPVQCVDLAPVAAKALPAAADDGNGEDVDDEHEDAEQFDTAEH